MRFAKMFPLCLSASLFGFSCDAGDSESRILVDVSSVPSRTSKLTVTATHYGQPAMNSADVTAPFERFGLRFPHSFSGRLTLSATSFDNDDCTHGSGQTGIDLPIPFAELSLSLTAQSPRKCPNLDPCAAGKVCPFKNPPPFAEPPTSNTIESIWAIASNDIWAGGAAGTLLHYDGTAWTLYTAWGQGDFAQPPSTSFFHGIWGVASNDVWAVGSGGIIYHYDGVRWRSRPSPVMQSLYSIWGVSKSEIWAVGQVPTSNSQPVFLHYDGSSWQPIINSVIGTSTLSGVWAANPNSIYASTSSSTTLVYFSGTSWSAISTGAALPTGKGLHAIWGTPDAKTIFAVGDGGTIVRFRDGTWTQISQYDPSKADLYDMSGYGNQVVAVGPQGTVLRADPPYDTFVPQGGGPSGLNLRGLSCSSKGICWVGGSFGYLGYLDLRP